MAFTLYATIGALGAGLISADPDSVHEEAASADEKKTEQAAKPAPQDDTTTK